MSKNGKMKKKMFKDRHKLIIVIIEYSHFPTTDLEFNI